MKSYSEYKEIGLDFLDSLPAHWDFRKLKFLSLVNFSNVDKHSFEEEIPVRLCNYVDVYKNDFIKPDMEFMKATASQSEIEKFVLRKGDVLITKDSESWEDIAVPALVTENMDDVLCGYHLAQIRPSSISGNFLFWVLGSATLNDQYKVEAHGITRYGLGKDSIENSIIPFPSLPEQQAIADFLDRKTAQIDTLIEKKQRQIDLLQEQRTALINHAITKGMNPNTPMKDSGVEWLGEIPSHWYVVPMRRMLDVRDGTHDTPNYIEPGDNAVPFVTSKDFDGDIINFGGTKYISPDDHQKFIQRSKVDKGDVLMSMIGGNIGKALIVYDKIEFSIKNVALFKTYGDISLSKFILYYIRSGLLDIQINIQSRGGAQSFLSLSDIRNLIFFKIPKQEYVSITDFLDEHTDEIERQIQLIQSQINLINEYRTALISEAVTGKIDVRDIK